MSTSPEATLLLLGLKGTGKTHFLVALDWVLDCQGDPDGLVHEEHADDRTYLQPLREKWLRGEELERTSRLSPPPPHQLLVRHPASGIKVGFHLPDFAGESFDAQFVTRSFPGELHERIKNSTGLFLFVHCDSNADHAILESPAFIDASDSAGSQEAPAATTGKDWTLEDAGNQIKLVDLLQFISEIRRGQSQLSIAVMLSAWDLVENAPLPASKENPKEPVAFLSRRWPLVDQFLRSNADIFRVRVFGVSARGGGKSAAEIARLTGMDNPSDRILIVDGAHHSSDLSRPVRWLLGMMPESTENSDV